MKEKNDSEGRLTAFMETALNTFSNVPHVQIRKGSYKYDEEKITRDIICSV